MLFLLFISNIYSATLTSSVNIYSQYSKKYLKTSANSIITSDVPLTTFLIRGNEASSGVSFVEDDNMKAIEIINNTAQLADFMPKFSNKIEQRFEIIEKSDYTLLKVETGHCLYYEPSIDGFKTMECNEGDKRFRFKLIDGEELIRNNLNKFYNTYSA